MLRWFDSQLKGIDNGILDEPPVKIFVMERTNGALRTSGHWQERVTRITIFTAAARQNSSSGDGSLNIKPPDSELADKYNYDPADPVRTIGGMGPYDQRGAELRQDVLVYTTSP